MSTPDAPSASVRYTTLSDRFRSLWTFYQFLGGVLKHLDEGPIPFSYDFQGLHGRLQESVHTIGLEGSGRTSNELDQIDRELDRIHREISRIEGELPPSTLRRFFDHIQRQDEKILCALIKFYLMYKHFEQDTLDKLDILVTRLAEYPSEAGPIVARDPSDLEQRFENLGDFTDLSEVPAAELAPLVEAVLSIRQELEEIDEYMTLVDSKVYERYRRLKQRLGRTALHPSLLVEITITNIVAKNRFRELFETEEKKVVEKTNRIHEIERYLANHPELANDDVQKQLEDFRHFRIRYESGRRKENVKRDDITDLTRAMQGVLALFDPALDESPEVPETPTEEPAPFSAPPIHAPVASISNAGSAPDSIPSSGFQDEPTRTRKTSINALLAPDPLLNETIHRLIFALEMVVWDQAPDQVVASSEIREFKLETWEADAYRALASEESHRGTSDWELQSFFLLSAALRVKMENEAAEIRSIDEAGDSERLYEALERSAQSLERARDMEHRFQWFVDDMVFRGDTNRLEQIFRSRFRFLHVYSGLWLDHQRSGGLTPL